MKKISALLIVVFLSVFFSFFNPAAVKINISVFNVINAVALAVCSMFFVLKQSYINNVKLSKAERFFALLLGFCLTLGCGLTHATGFGVFYGSIVAGVFSVAAWAFYCWFSLSLFKFLFLKAENFTRDSKLLKKSIRLPGFVINGIENNSLKFYFLFLISLWAVPFLMNLPGWIMFDTRNQYNMFYHIPNHHTDASVLIDQGQYITQHHSVPHTLIVGVLLGMGKKLFGTFNAGIFAYCIIQYSVMALILANVLKSLKEHFGVKLTFVFLLLFSLHPFFASSAFLVTKDVYFCGFFALYMLKYCELIRTPAKIKETKFFIQFLLLTIALILLRNNALYTLIIIAAGLFFFTKQKKVVALYMAIFLVFNICYTNVLLPAFKISSGSVREMLSIPFQQTANYVNKYPEEVTQKEKQAISKILDYEVLKNSYNPNLSDAVKDTYNKYATGEDLKNYFVTWGKMLLKHPITYVEAFIHQNYGYYCPGVKDSVTYDCKNDFYARRAMKNADGIDITAKKPGVIRLTYYGIQNAIYFAPFLNLIMDSGAYIWLWIIMMLIILRKGKSKKYLMYYLPYFSYLIFILVGPANGTIYSRYIMPFIYTLPIMFLPLFEGMTEAKTEKLA